MKQMAGQFGFGGRSATRKQAKSRKGKKVQGAGRARPALPPGWGVPDLSSCRRACASCRRGSTSCRRGSTSAS